MITKNISLTLEEPEECYVCDKMLSQNCAYLVLESSTEGMSLDYVLCNSCYDKIINCLYNISK